MPQGKSDEWMGGWVNGVRMGLGELERAKDPFLPRLKHVRTWGRKALAGADRMATTAAAVEREGDGLWWVKG